MAKISLSQAKEILKKQGYEVETTLVEALLERYALFEDIDWRIQELEENEQITPKQAEEMRTIFHNKKDDIELKFEKYYDDCECISDYYWEIIDILIADFTPDHCPWNY